MDRKRQTWLDIAKILACICVLVNHMVAYMLVYNGSHDIKSLSSNLFWVIQFSFCKIGVPLFIMITGSLILGKKYNLKDVFKKIYRIMIPMILISLPFYIKNNGISLLFIKDFLKSPIVYHLWYLYMLVGLYLITPLVQKAIKNFDNRDYLYLIAICFILPSVIDLVNKIFNISIYSDIMVGLLSIPLVYYITGLFIKNLEKNKKYRNIAWLISGLSYICYFLLYLIPYLNTKSISYKYDIYTNIFVGLLSISIFYLIRYYFEDREFKLEKAINEISMTTFGIYLIHTIVGQFIYNTSIVQYIFRFNSIVGVLSLEISCFTLSCIIIYIIRKIPIVKKFL